MATGEYEDLMKAGVVDPTKVTRTALQNAASISALLLTTEALVTELPFSRWISTVQITGDWVKVHGGHVMQKIRAHSTARLAGMVERRGATT